MIFFNDWPESPNSSALQAYLSMQASYDTEVSMKRKFIKAKVTRTFLELLCTETNVVTARRLYWQKQPNRRRRRLHGHLGVGVAKILLRMSKASSCHIGDVRGIARLFNAQCFSGFCH